MRKAEAPGPPRLGSHPGIAIGRAAVRAALAALWLRPPAPPLGSRTCTGCRRPPGDLACWAPGCRTHRRGKCSFRRPSDFAPCRITVARGRAWPSLGKRGEEGRGLGRVSSPPPGTPGSTEPWLGRCPGVVGQPAREVARRRGRLVVRAPGQPGFRFPRELPVPTGKGAAHAAPGVCLSTLVSVGRPRPSEDQPPLPTACFIRPSPCLPGQLGAGDRNP